MQTDAKNLRAILSAVRRIADIRDPAAHTAAVERIAFLIDATRLLDLTAAAELAEQEAADFESRATQHAG